MVEHRVTRAFFFGAIAELPGVLGDFRGRRATRAIERHRHAFHRRDRFASNCMQRERGDHRTGRARFGRSAFPRAVVRDHLQRDAMAGVGRCEQVAVPDRPRNRLAVRA